MSWFSGGSARQEIETFSSERELKKWIANNKDDLEIGQMFLVGNNIYVWNGKSQSPYWLTKMLMNK